MKIRSIEALGAAYQRIQAPATARSLRESAGLSQAEMAAVVGVTQSAMSRLESGKRLPGPEVAARWAAALDRISKTSLNRASANPGRRSTQAKPALGGQ